MEVVLVEQVVPWSEILVDILEEVQIALKVLLLTHSPNPKPVGFTKRKKQQSPREGIQ